MSDSALHDQLIAERRRIRAAWQVPRKVAKPRTFPLVFPPLPQQNIKSLKERLAEAEVFRGELSDRDVNNIRNVILRSARDFKEGVPQKRCPTIGRIKYVVAEHFGIAVEQITTGKKDGFVLPRQIAMYIATQTTRRLKEDIGGLFGGRDPTTVTKSVQKIERTMAADPVFAEEVAALKGMLES